MSFYINQGFNYIVEEHFPAYAYAHEEVKSVTMTHPKGDYLKVSRLGQHITNLLEGFLPEIHITVSLYKSYDCQMFYLKAHLPYLAPIEFPRLDLKLCHIEHFDTDVDTHCEILWQYLNLMAQTIQSHEDWKNYRIKSQLKQKLEQTLKNKTHLGINKV